MASSSTSAKVNDKNSLRNEIKPEPQEASNLVLLTDNEKSESAIEIGKRKRDQLIGSDHQNILTVLDENRNSIVKFFDNDLDDDVEDADAARKYSRRFTSRETSDYSYYRAIGSLKCEMSKFGKFFKFCNMDGSFFLCDLNALNNRNVYFKIRNA